MQHADEEAVLLLGVVLALVGAVGDPQLMERSLVSTDLSQQARQRSFNFCTLWVNKAASHLKGDLEVVLPLSPVLS